jgi:hypothetical protein
MTPLLISAIGFAGAAFTLGSYLTRRHAALCFVLSAGLVLFAIHFQLLGSTTTAVLCLYGAARYIASPWVLGKSSALRWRLTGVALAGVVAIGVLTWSDWRSGVSLAGNLILVAGGFQLRDADFRRLLLLSECVFLVNSAVFGSVPGVLLSACCLALNGATLARSRVRAA